MDDYEILSEDYAFLNPKEEIFKQESFFRNVIEKYQVTNLLGLCLWDWMALVYVR